MDRRAGGWVKGGRAGGGGGSGASWWAAFSPAKLSEQHCFLRFEIGRSGVRAVEDVGSKEGSGRNVFEVLRHTKDAWCGWFACRVGPQGARYREWGGARKGSWRGGGRTGSWRGGGRKDSWRGGGRKGSWGGEGAKVVGEGEGGKVIERGGEGSGAKWWTAVSPAKPSKQQALSLRRTEGKGHG